MSTESIPSIKSMPEEPRIYLVLSNHHGAFWGPDESGYTQRLERAGRYSASEAKRISNTRNGGAANADGVYPEVVVIAPEAEALILKLQGEVQHLKHELDVSEVKRLLDCVANFPPDDIKEMHGRYHPADGSFEGFCCAIAIIVLAAIVWFLIHVS